MSDASPERLEHLKMVQDVVSRMADNSVQMKTWAVSLVTAVFLFSGLSDDPHWLIALGGCIPVILCWWMDARYLHLSKCYRKLYREVAEGKSLEPFEMDYEPYRSSVEPVRTVAWSWSVGYFYPALLFFLLILLIILVW